MIWAEWWIWVAGGIVIGIVELLVPVQIFLGFSIGAIVTGSLIAAGVLGSSFPILLVVFGVLSALSWLAMRTILGTRKGQTKSIDRDINEN